MASDPTDYFLTFLYSPEGRVGLNGCQRAMCDLRCQTYKDGFEKRGIDSQKGAYRRTLRYSHFKHLFICTEELVGLVFNGVEVVIKTFAG